jgi:hypothetical protein
MESMVSKTFLKVMGFCGSLLLSVFAGIFALLALALMCVGIVEGDLLTASISAFAGFIAWVCWSVRKDTLV